MKYFLGSAAFLILALLSTGDIFLLVGLGIVSLPIILLLQWLTLAICKRIKGISKYSRYASLIPSIAFSAWIVATMSIWAQPNQVFKVVLGQSIPSSVKKFYYTEEAWTDYMAQLYFEISPEELEGILREHDFRKTGLSRNERIDFGEMEWITESLQPILNPIRYRYDISENSEGRGGGFCDLYTNAEHNRAYVFYAVD